MSDTSIDYDTGVDDAVNHLGYNPPEDDGWSNAAADYDEGYQAGLAYLKLEEKKYEGDSCS